MAADPIAALVAYLKAVPVAGGRVYGGELPRAQNASMPRAAVVLKGAGGGVLGQGYQNYGDLRVDADCYGESPLAGWQLYLEVYALLKHLRREVAAGVLLHWAKSSSRGISARDPETDWPLTVSSWQVLASEVEVV